MLAIFCLRLASGLVACLLALSPAQVNPRFLRVHHLTALGLAAASGVFLRETSDRLLWLALGGGVLFSFLGALSWSLDRAPAGRALTVLATVTLGVALVRAGLATAPEEALGWVLASELTSAFLLGATTTAMLLGHSYLIAPTMSIAPLLRVLGLMLAAVLARGVVSGAGLWSWTAGHSLGKLDDVTIFLPVRWAVGVVGPLVLGVMAWQTAKIRSTQSATGILYVVVILSFLGELISLVLSRMTQGYQL